jgi:hypothetical protein
MEKKRKRSLMKERDQREKRDCGLIVPLRSEKGIESYERQLMRWIWTPINTQIHPLVRVEPSSGLCRLRTSLRSLQPQPPQTTTATCNINIKSPNAPPSSGASLTPDARPDMENSENRTPRLRRKIEVSTEKKKKTQPCHQRVPSGTN